MPSIYSRFEEYNEEEVLKAYLNRHYRSAFMTEEEAEFLKKPAPPERSKEGQKIRRRITERMVKNADKLRVARCPECERILESPRAGQCLWCGNKFHDKPRPPKRSGRRVEIEVIEKEEVMGEEVPLVTKTEVQIEP
jgi:ribosomal protein L37AE/L43A